MTNDNENDETEEAMIMKVIIINYNRINDVMVMKMT